MYRLRLVLIRHGESQNNLHQEISMEVYEKNRVCDPAITIERGQQQATAAAHYLQQQQQGNNNNNALLQTIDEIHVSPMRRTLQTALPMAHALPDIPVVVKTDLYEISGVFDKTVGRPGMTRSEMQAEFPTFQLPADVTEEGWYPVAQGRETPQQGRQRCRHVWQRYCLQQESLTKDTTIVLVVHGDFIDNLLQVAFGLEAPARSNNPTEEKVWVFPSWNTSITALEIHTTGQIPTLLFHNYVGHLSSDLVKTDKLGKC